MAVILTYTKEDGSQEQIEFEDDVDSIKISSKRIVEIDLNSLSACTSLRKLDLSNNHLHSIDLTPLSTCTSLHELALDRNHLQGINLAPLKSCTHFQTLHIMFNKLQSIDFLPLSSLATLRTLAFVSNELQNIDLSPLKSCSNLQMLSLGGNQIQSIDLGPLVSCTNLRVLNLAKNMFQTIDLSPLSSCRNLEILTLSSCSNLESLDSFPLGFCTNLQELVLVDNQLKDTDLTPLILCNKLEKIALYKDSQQDVSSWVRLNGGDRVLYKRPPKILPWEFLSYIAERYDYDMRVQQDILYALGFGRYGFIDCDLTSLFSSIPPDSPQSTVKERIQKTLVNHITSAIDRKKSTTNLSIEKTVTNHGEMVKRAERIVELRTTEIRTVCVGVNEKGVDLRELYLTAYGYEILSALDMELQVREKELVEIRNAFHNLGLELNTSDRPIPAGNMSEGLKEAIWWIVKNRGKRWSHIEV